MATVKRPVDLLDTYPLDHVGPLRDLLLFDIGTTGFSGDTPQLYLIDCTYYDDFDWRFIRWFADSRESEKELPTALFTFVEHLKILVHFNGDGSDIPYLLKCCRRSDPPYNFARMKNVDIYKKIKFHRKLPGLGSMKQKSIEQFPGVTWDGKHNGGQSIEVYCGYLMTHESLLFDLLTLHNEDDLRGMPSILLIPSYVDMMETPSPLESQQLFIYDDMAGNIYPFPSLVLKGPYAIPVPLGYDSAPVSPGLSRDTLARNIAPSQGEFEYFYSGYKDYYYLPTEDTVIHKSVGEYVDRDVHTKTTVRTCCTKK